MTDLGKIEQGIEKLNQRKIATGVVDRSAAGGEDFARLMLNGLDLDLDELNHYRGEAVRATSESLERNMEEGKEFEKAFWVAVAACWVDGLQVGIHIGREEGE